jgi:RNA polymerase sigma factor (sigma-70 family)
MYTYIDEETDSDAEREELKIEGSHVDAWSEETEEPPLARLAAAEVVSEEDVPIADEGQSLIDMKSFERLVKQHSPRLSSFVRRRVGNPSDVEDIVQDTFVEAIKGMERYRGHSRPETWIFGIALNLIRSHYKRGRVREVVSADEEVEAIPSHVNGDPARLVEHREILERLNVICAGLSDETKEMLELVFDGCLTYEQAAVALGIPVGTVRSRISRVRLHLRQNTD